MNFVVKDKSTLKELGPYMEGVMKFRNLEKSHDFREYVKKWGEPVCRRRIITAPLVANANGKAVEIEQKLCEQPSYAHGLSSIGKEIREIEEEREELRSWVRKRKDMRENLNSLGLNMSLLKNKPDKSESEKRILNNMMEKKKKKNAKKDVVTPSNVPKMSSGHVGELPMLGNHLPIALTIIADYLQGHRLRLLDLFSKADRNKDWLATRDELKNSLVESGVPLSDAEIDELVIALDVNNDGHLSYKELAAGIDAYRKDRRWQKLKAMFEVVVENCDKQQELSVSFNERNIAFDSLRLPKLDFIKQNKELAENLTTNKKSLLHERQRMRKKKMKDAIKIDNTTTLPGSIGESKTRYLEFIDKECLKCIEKIHEYDLPIKSEDLVKVLIPPSENSRIACENYLSYEHSIFPSNHIMNRSCRNRQKTLISNTDATIPKETKRYSIPSSTHPPLPRVATLDFKNRSKEGKKHREEFSVTSPTRCWPQHLLDKIRIYMDDDQFSDGKEVLFAHVK